jgi:outer membrane protein assembly factor BamB
MVCFRGGAQRNYYGEGPAPRGHLKVLWRNVIGADPAAPQWNGVGWTGQPLAVEWPEEVRKHMNFLSQPGPKTEIIVGGMDSQIHFYDSETGKPSRRPLHISPQNLIKGTVSVDPRGYPLVYVGTGLNRGRSGYHVYSLTDFKELLFLPGYDSRAPRHWPAFDGNGLVYGDRLLETGENGIFYSVKLNTKWDAETGKISLNPQITRVPISSGGIESSISVFDHYGYCSDNHGMLYRIDLDNPTHVKRLRALGDDADTTPTFDTDGNFYVGIQVDNRHSAGAKGTLFKLHAPDGALVWRWDFPAQTFHGSSKIHDINGGVLSTAAVWPEGDLVFTTTAHHPRMNQGALVALDRKTGKPRWTFRMKSYTWSSPTVVDGAVIAADAAGELYVRDAATGDNLLKDADGSPVASIKLGSCVEASPLVWKGRIYIGVRGGALVCVGPAESTPEENSTTETAGQ